MDALDLALALSVVTVLLGLVAVLRLEPLGRWMGIGPLEPKGRSELRATYGAAFGGVGVAAAILHNESAYWVLASLWIARGVLRFLTAAMDSSWSTWVMSAVLFDAAMAITLVVLLLVG